MRPPQTVGEHVNSINEAAIVVALLAAIVATTVVTITSGSADLAATGLRDLSILLGGALAGVKIPKS